MTQVPTSILWDPNLPAHGNRVQTEAQLIAAINASEAPLQIALAAACTVTQVFDAKGAIWSGIGVGGLIINDGGQIKNSREFSSMFFVANGTSVPPFAWDADFVKFRVANTGFENAGTTPLWNVRAGQSFTWILEGSSVEIGDETKLLVSIAATGALFLYTVALTGGEDAPALGADWASGAGVLTILDDGTYGLAKSNIPGFTGTYEQFVSGTGLTTAERPTPAETGATIFDTTLGKPIWWNGSAWVDATGAPV